MCVRVRVVLCAYVGLCVYSKLMPPHLVPAGPWHPVAGHRVWLVPPAQRAGTGEGQSVLQTQRTLVPQREEGCRSCPADSAGQQLSRAGPPQRT